MQDINESGCSICKKIYKKSMVAVVFNVIVMIALLVETQRNINLLEEGEFRLRESNITDIACSTFCKYTIDSQDNCCHTLQQTCIDKQVCLNQKISEYELDITDSKEVVIMCFAILAISFGLLLVYCFIKSKERTRERQEREERLLNFSDGEGEEQPHVQFPLGNEAEWEEYTQTNNADEICAICHGKLMMTRVGELRCQHVFHSQCIREWFESRDSGNTCPICRRIN